ncbi:MAG: hypothetical protein GEU78_16560 [Actinobacteria bacterium]|nr:hypothetical protein [Actinomycetota bacterium]
MGTRRLGISVASRFVANPNLERELLRSAQYRQTLGQLTEEGVQEAKALARREAYDTGAYHDSIRADAGVEDGEWQGRINAFVPYAHLLEFGSARPGLPGRARRILSRGAQAAGLKFSEGR